MQTLTNRLFHGSAKAVNEIIDHLATGESYKAVFHTVRIYRGNAVDEIVHVSDAPNEGETITVPEDLQKILTAWVAQASETNAEKLIFSIPGIQFFIRKSSIDAITYSPEPLTLTKSAPSLSSKAAAEKTEAKESRRSK